MSNELWYDIPNFPNYQISTQCRFRSVFNGVPSRMLSISKGLQVVLGKDGNYSAATIYRTVFGQDPSPKPEPMRGYWISRSPALPRKVST
jgi:hypothetical protein